MGQPRYLVFNCRDRVAYLSSHYPYGLMHMHALWTGTPKEINKWNKKYDFFPFTSSSYPRFIVLWWNLASATTCLLTLFRGMASRERDMVYCRKYTLFCRQRNKWNSSYQSEENNNPGLDLPSPVNDRGNYAHILRQANRITVRFCLWLGCHPPPLLLWVLIDPLPLSLITLLSLSLPVLFHLFLCLNLLSLSPSTSVFLPCLFSRLMNLKLVGIVWSDETPPPPPQQPSPPSSLFRALISAPQCLHTPVSRGNTAVHHSSTSSLLTLLLPLN